VRPYLVGNGFMFGVVHGLIAINRDLARDGLQHPQQRLTDLLVVAALDGRSIDLVKEAITVGPDNDFCLMRRADGRFVPEVNNQRR